MKKIKIYLDTSAIGYLDEKTSPKEMGEMQQLWELIKRGEYEASISSVVVDELMANNNIEKRDILLDYLKQINFDIISITDEVHTTAEAVIKMALYLIKITTTVYISLAQSLMVVIV